MPLYILCKEAEEYYLIDTNQEKVYSLNIADSGEIHSYSLIQQDMQNFLRWHPYIEEIAHSNSLPKSIR